MSTLASFSRRISSWLAWLAAGLVMAIPLFAHLDELPIVIWDELRNAQNALEMTRNGHRIVTYISGQPETWNTKPPLLTWILALTQSTFGYNELSIRLPSALFAAMTGFYILALAKRHTGRWLPGLFAVIVLMTSGGYVMNHGTRTGDYDALLTLFTVLAAGSLLDYLRSFRPVQLLFCMLALTGAVMTKGVAGLFIAPAMLGVVLWTRSFFRILRSPAFWVGLGIFLLVVGGYYLRREQLQPGYLRLVWENELGGRYGTALEAHQHDGWFYWRWLREGGFSYWYMLLLPASVAGIALRDAGSRRLGVLCASCAICLMLIMSTAATKLWWYILPVYPFLALLCGMFLDQLCRLLSSWSRSNRVWSRSLLPAALIIGFAAPAYLAIVKSSLEPQDTSTTPEAHDAGVYLKTVCDGQRELQATALCGDYYSLIWYQDVLAMRGRPIPAVDSTALQAGTDVMVWEETVKARLKSRYKWRPKETFRSVEVLHIDGLRASLPL